MSSTKNTIEIEKLFLDNNNPRFGGDVNANQKQEDVLDVIVKTFGIDDVLSSIAVNGYFEAEPLVCKKENDDKYIVLEGNRRLAACLIIMGDNRARNHSNLTNHYKKIWESHGSKPINPIPAVVFEGENLDPTILSYLGVRHIAASQPWDSYAKAAWVAKVVEKNDLPLADISLMIGDNNKTISRLLEGYYFIRQLIESGKFQPQDSIRKGRGSVTDYPFSWVYTMLSYSTVRDYLNLRNDPTNNTPIAENKLTEAALVTTSMFGDKSIGKSSAISDSRQLGDLAAVFADTDKVLLLESGKTVEEIERATRPFEERLKIGLKTIREIQTDMITGMSENDIPFEFANNYKEIASRNRRSAQDIEKRFIDALTTDADRIND